MCYLRFKQKEKKSKSKFIGNYALEKNNLMKTQIVPLYCDHVLSRPADCIQADNWRAFDAFLKNSHLYS